ncbi:TIGR03826 family flagellar region protein [Aquibacillus saliphilus]|uniref:TIGR03826 family flagellar region protein n=1 Tax=Aquibacillus saliphilus TaxID=1909422 RepID=UPI001CF034BA|nr:TIGR03826 family flagellar region protein [Aquibacillus saliphilus]
MGELANCPNCNALFVQGIRDICQDCYKIEEQAFRTVYDFIKQRKNRQATIAQIVEATEVDEELIMKFVKEKRLRASQFPNLTYPCEKCGKGINDGILCGSCSSELVNDLQTQEKIDQVSARNKQQEQSESHTYVSYHKNRNNY